MKFTKFIDLHLNKAYFITIICTAFYGLSCKTSHDNNLATQHKDTKTSRLHIFNELKLLQLRLNIIKLSPEPDGTKNKILLQSVQNDINHLEKNHYNKESINLLTIQENNIIRDKKGLINKSTPSKVGNALLNYLRIPKYLDGLESEIYLHTPSMLFINWHLAMAPDSRFAKNIVPGKTKRTATGIAETLSLGFAFSPDSSFYKQKLVLEPIFRAPWLKKTRELRNNLMSNITDYNFATDLDNNGVYTRLSGDSAKKPLALKEMNTKISLLNRQQKDALIILQYTLFNPNEDIDIDKVVRIYPAKNFQRPHESLIRISKATNMHEQLLSATVIEGDALQRLLNDSLQTINNLKKYRGYTKRPKKLLPINNKATTISDYNKLVEKIDEGYDLTLALIDESQPVLSPIDLSKPSCKLKK